MTTMSATPRRATGARRAVRAVAVIGGALAALVVWAVAKALLPDVREPSFGSSDPQVLSPTFVVIASVIGAALAWAAIEVLERLTPNPRRAWSLLAPIALVISFGGPLSGHGISDGNRLALALMHVAVAAVVIPVYYRTAPVRTARHHLE